MKRILLLCLGLTAFVNASITYRFDKDRIEAGQTFKFQLIAPLSELPQNREAPRLELQKDFKFLGLDSTDDVIRPKMDVMDEMMSFMRGGTGARPYKARIYSFKIKAPKKTGVFNIGTLSWIIEGRKIIQDQIPIPVQRSYNDDALVVSLTPSKKTVYEGEQFSVNLSLHLYEHFLDGPEATDMSTGNDFIVHRNDKSKIKYEYVEGTNNREAKASTKFAWLSPTKSGDLQIPPFKFKYTKKGEAKYIADTIKTPFGQTISSVYKQEPIEAEAQSAPLTITVLPLPTEGKPDNFSGMVGNYSFSANFDRTNLKVGEALTLAISIKGDGTPGTITDPKLPDFSEFRSVPPENSIDKKVKGNKVITSKDIKVFLYPKKKGSFEIPAITYSWFNPAKKKYETASAGPWTIEVEKGDAPAEPVYQAPVATTPGSSTPVVQKQEIEFLGSDIRFIHPVTDKSETAAPHRSVLFWILFIAAIPFYLIVNAAITRKRKRDSNTALVRKDKANKLLKEKFAKAREALRSGDGKAFYAALENGLIDYLSNLTNVEFKGMTRPQMKQELEKRGVNSGTINDIDSWLEKCAFVRFAPVTASTEEQSQMLADVEKLCEALKL